MSLAIKYENAEDAKMRLRNTIVLYREEPVLIKDVTHGEGNDILRVKFQELPVKAEAFDPVEEGKRKYISSKHFDIAPFKLGYVNNQGKLGAFYVTRLPNRIQKQGFCGENFRAFNNYGVQVTWQCFLGIKESVAMIKGDYPSFDQALAGLKKVSSVAFSRDFCLVKDEVVPELIYLYHKGNKVGYFSKSEVLLGQKFGCLKESLQEMQIKVGVCA